MAFWVGLCLLVRVFGQVNSAWFPATISTQQGSSFNSGSQPAFSNLYWPIIGFTCSGANCGTKVVAASLNAVARTSNIQLGVDYPTASLTDVVTSTALQTTACPLGAVAVRLTCGGTDCATLQLQCMRPTATSNNWRTINNGTYADIGPFGTPNSGTCPPSSVLCGISCVPGPGIEGCGSIKLRCCYVEIRVCDVGYAFDPSWACAGIACAEQVNPPNGLISSTNFNSYPSTSTLQCNNGYIVNGNPQRTCDTNGQWSGIPANCTGRLCQTRSSIVNGWFNLSNGYIYPTTATFNCTSGFVVSQDSQDCFYDGTWTGGEVTCVGVQCEALEDPNSGLVTVTNGYSYPATATLACDPGYNIVGLSSMSCSPNGKWPSTLGTCAGKQCNPLPSSDRYTISLLNAGKYPSTAFITCKPGCVGATQVLTCNPDGNWSGTIPDCPYISCGYPTDPGGTYCADSEVCKNFSAPTNLTYRPNKGGNASWTCQPGWTWWGVEQSVNCQANGIWSDLVTWCHSVYCNALPNIASTSLTITNQQWYPSTGVYTCVSGYIANSTTVMCQKDRTWVGDMSFTCVGRQCDVVQFATPQCNCKSQTTNNGNYPSTTYMECLLGYQRLSGSSYRQCSVDGSWTNTNLMCQGVPCVTLTCSPVPCTVSYSNNKRYPSSATAVCPAGYYPSVPGGVTTCATDGNWFDRIECIGVLCDALDPITHGVRSLTSLNYPSTVSTSCEPGYMLSGGSQFLTCGTNGAWSGPFPRCVGVPCATTSFTSKVQRFVSQNNFSYPDTVTAICDPGYEIAQNTFNCSTLGVYCCAPFNCTGIACNPVANHTSYTYSYNSSLIFPVGVTFQCIEDFYTIQPTQGYCLPSSNFNILPPLCLRFAIDELYMNNVISAIPVNATTDARFVKTDSYSGGDTLTIRGSFGNYVPAISYGPTALIQFPCNIQSHSSTELKCTTTKSYGARCRVYLRYNQSEVNNITIISPPFLFITHPQPTITQQSLILWNTPPPPVYGWTWPLKASSTKGGDTVMFNGTFFSDWKCCVKVFYGPAVDDLSRECVVEEVSNSVMVCTTSPGEQGPHYFQVTVYDVSSELGKDGYIYPLGPIVQSVEGCRTVPRGDNSTEAVDCPTAGGVKITIFGRNFIDLNSTLTAPTFMIGSTFGVASNYTGESMVVTLPVGIGATSVIVASLAGQSAAKSLITYAEPSFTGMSGCRCANPAICSPTDCSRIGESITIFGANFGKSAASVFLVGVGPCEPVAHDAITPHSKLTCRLPPGFALHQPVALLQLGGFLAFANSPLDVSYSQCPPGQYQNGASTVCAYCNPGQFSSLSGQTICENCAYGAYSNRTGASTCTKALEGSYVPNVAATSSILCAPGTFSLTIGAYQCKDCPPGFYAPNPGTSNCLPCETGRAQASQGQLSCIACLSGYFAASPGLMQCVACAAGYVAKGSGSAACEACPVAQYSANRSACVPCDAGKYVSVQGASSCLQCEEGYFASRAGSEYCEACPVGAHQPSKEGRTCLNCSVSTFSNIPGASKCFNCEAGSYADVPGLDVCKDCPIGKYGPLPGLAACIACAEGKFAGNVRSVKCTDCPAGTSQNVSGMGACDDCPRGKFAQDPGYPACQQCLAGRIAQNFRSVQCTPCPKGTAAVAEGGTDCEQCDKGFYGPAEGQTQCLACAVGTYSVVWRSTSCVLCSMGRYQNVTGLTDCVSCLEGYFANAMGASQCRACDPGSFTNSKGYAVCQACQPGTATARSASSRCADCAPGHYAQHEHSFVCDSCPRGRFQSYSRGSTCAPCEEGTSSNQPYANQTGAIVCEQCAPGMYASLSGSYTCSPCERGKYADQFHSSTCSFCLEGTANNFTGQVACIDCLSGHYAETLGSIQCQPCLSGKFTDVVRTVRCRLCQTGTATNASGSTACRDCLPGTFTSNAGSTSCDLCPKGYYSAVPRTSSCLKCSKGTYNNITGQTECSDCELGTYSNAIGAFECSFCQPGSYADVIRSVLCGDCPAGRFIGVQAASTCELCARGRYNRQPGSGDCMLCERGSISAELGAAKCDECKSGQFGLKDGESSCTNCVAGKFQKREGASGCEVCEAGTYSESGREICTTCGPGTAMPFKGAVRCDLCDVNGRSANPPLDCVCNAGYFAPTRTLDENFTTIRTLGCASCPKGLDCSLPGETFETLKVVAGWWRTDEASLDMYKCVLPTHCLGGRNSTCAQARIGLVCSLCMDGYAASGAGRTGECEKCKERSNSLVQAIFFCLLLFMGLGVLYYLVLRSQRQNMQKYKDQTQRNSTTDSNSSYIEEEEMYDPTMFDSWDETNSPTPRSKRKTTVSSSRKRQTVVAANPNMRKQSSVSSLQDSTFSVTSLDASTRKGSLQEAEEERIKQKRLDKKRRAGVTGKLRIILSMLQIGTTLVSSLNIPWPTLFRDFLGALNFVNLDFVPWQSVGCVAHISYFTKLYMITALPILAFLALIAFFMVPSWLWDRRDLADDEAYRVRRELSRAKLWRLMLFTVFLVYPYVSSSVFRMYVCYYLEGSYYMKMDFEVKCYEEQWNSMIGPSAAMIILYPFGIPFVTFVLLFSARRVLDDPKTRVKLGFLYESYTNVAWFFELIVMINKLFLTSFVGFFPDNMQMPAALLWLYGYMSCLLLLQPYIYKSDDRLDMFSISLLMLLCLCGHVLNTAPTLDPTTDFLLSIVLILLFVVVFLAFNFMAIRLLVRKARVLLMARWAKYRKEKRVQSFRLGRGVSVAQREGPTMGLAPTVGEPAMMGTFG